MTATAIRLALACGALITQLLLQIVWHAWVVPAPRAALVLSILPLLPGLWVSLDNLRRGVLIGGIVSLFYFCHGIAELWNSAAPHALAALEIAMSVIAIALPGWDGLQARRAAKRLKREG